MHVCVCVPFVFFLEIRNEKKTMIQQALAALAPEIPSHCHFGSGGVAVTRDHQRSPESPVTSRYIEVRQQIAECLGICLLPDGGLEENY